MTDCCGPEIEPVRAPSPLPPPHALFQGRPLESWSAKGRCKDTPPKLVMKMLSRGLRPPSWIVADAPSSDDRQRGALRERRGSKCPMSLEPNSAASEAWSIMTKSRIPGEFCGCSCKFTKVGEECVPFYFSGHGSRSRLLLVLLCLSQRAWGR